VAKDKDFTFYIPVELCKSNKDDDDESSWQIQGIASTADEDLQGEIVEQEGLDISVLKAGRGLFNWDHQKGPENIIGQIEDAEFIRHDGDKKLLVKGYLFKQQDRAKAFYNIMKSIKKGTTSRVHLSIEGKILERSFANQKNIKKARVEKVALTLDPVNPYTYVDLIKSLSSTEEPTPNGGTTQEIVIYQDETITLPKQQIQDLISVAKKAMMAGAGHAGAPSSRSGGAALQVESLESKSKKTTYKSKHKKIMKSVIEGLKESYPEIDELTLAKCVADVYIEKYLKKGK